MIEITILVFEISTTGQDWAATNTSNRLLVTPNLDGGMLESCHRYRPVGGGGTHDMAVKLAIVGHRDDGHLRATRGGSQGAQASSSVTDALDDVEVVAYFNLSPSAREHTVEPEVIELEDDDVLEIEVAGGFRIWTSARRYSQEIVLLRPEAKVGDAVVVDTLPRVSEGGITEWAQNGLRVFRLKKDGFADSLAHPEKWPLDLTQLASDLGIDPAAELPAWFATRAVTLLIEDRLRPRSGLYSWKDATRRPSPVESEPAPAQPDPQPASFDGFDVAKPMLVFIHGIASSTLGSFGAFLSDDAQPQWQGLCELFGDNIYAFEHRTISDNPIDNAIDLVTALPPMARVNIVSHSRGGLVGDLLSLRSINTDLFARFDRTDPELQQVSDHDRRQLKRLAALLAQKNLRIERFVRCASPARGALLAAENLDYLMSVLTNLVGLIPEIGGNPLYAVIKRIALEIVSNRTRPALVPGIDAMTPGSPLIALLNNLEVPAAGEVGVLAGDTARGNWLKRLGVFATDQFLYESRDNDLVVNTDAMFHGARRDVAGYIFDRGADVNHFNYFRNPRTRAAVVEWLSPPTDKRVPDQFRELPVDELQPVPMPRSTRELAPADRPTELPIVVVLPGIMGSQLDVGDDETWLKYDAVLGGRITELADLAAPDVTPVALIGDGYRELCDFLAQSHELIPFAYDWRRSVNHAAGLLATEIDNALNRTGQPVRIVAHGMGGLVVRAMISARPDLWNRLCERTGARLVMLGTPNRGCYEVVETLLGTATGVQQLALLDGSHGAGAIAAMVANCPGVLELLPDQNDYFEQRYWEDCRRRYGQCAVPPAQLLAEARATLNGLAAQTVIPHSERVHYVAGASTRTVSGVDIIDGRVVLSVTNDGDGQVTYLSGLLPGVSAWYMDAVHGDLASHKPGFFAVKELLETGTTSRLRSTPPSVERGGQATYRAFPVPVLYPTKTSLAAGFLGKNPRRAYRPTEQPGFRVSVVHGDLQYARYPIVVGHYEGDTIVGAEAQVDTLLGGALKQRYSLGLYPGEFRSVAVVLSRPGPTPKPADRLRGALVVGLGKWGELNAGQLGDLLRRAALHYLLELRENPAGASKVGLSVLLIGGTSAANIAVADSVGAILRAIAQVNRELAAPDGVSTSIEEIEIIELYADTAIEAAHAVNGLVEQIGKELDTEIEAVPLLQRGREGRRRLMSTTSRDAWRRWEVSVVTPPPQSAPAYFPKPLADRLKRAVIESGSADRELVAALAELAIGTTAETGEEHREIRFLTLSDRARAEVTSQQRQPELVERLIKDSISQPYFSQDESRVLFELTIPNELKSGLAQVDNLVLVVDAESATYPWELMSAGDMPLCVAKGLVRQLQTSNYRPQIGARAGTSAYVVGDPQVSPPFNQLPGAHEEAKAIYDLLAKRRFDVAPPDEKPTALQVLAGLYKKPYRILHIAGHGHYEPPTDADGKARSGVVLDNGIFLTAVEVKQMQQVPELVFLNCCHIGQTGPDGTPSPPGVEFNRLAASVSRELIEMGVRAVVAAGWAVDDSAALFFATTFYSSMLDDSESFGRAITLARRRTFEKFSATTTWGAYQAYGDPDYRLDPSRGPGAMPRDRVDAAELIEAVRDIGRRAVGNAKDASALPAAVRDLQKLVDACPTDWLERADVLMEIGYAFGKLGQFERASEYLGMAIADDGVDSATTMQAVEELATYQASQADDGPDGSAQGDLHKGAIARLEGLIAVAPTAKRYSLLGDFYTRRAVAVPDARDARTALQQSAENYGLAYRHNVDRPSFDPCPVLRWLGAAAILREPVNDAATLIERCEATAAERFRTDGMFTTAIGIAEAELVRALTSGQLGKDAEVGDTELRHLQDLYRKVIRDSAPTASDRLSACKQIDTANALLMKLSPHCRSTKATVERLRLLRDQVAGADRLWA